MEEYKRKVELLRTNMRAKAITYNWHEPETSFIEAVLARGDRRVGDVLEEVWRTGGKMDAWGATASPMRDGLPRLRHAVSIRTFTQTVSGLGTRSCPGA
jgi:hypothetical protein